MSNLYDIFKTEDTSEALAHKDFLQAELEGFKQSLLKKPAPASKRLKLNYDIRLHPAYSQQSGETVLKKERLRSEDKAFDPYLSDSDVHWVTNTSGTAGPPVEIISSSQYYFLNLFQPLLRTWLRFTKKAFPREPILAVFLTDNAKYQKTNYQYPAGEFGAQLVYPILTVNQNAFDEFIWWAAQHDSAILSTKPNLLDLLVTRLNENKQLPRPRWKLIVVSGANLNNDLKYKAESILGVPVVSSYNTTEVGYIGSQCSHLKFHIDETLHEAEVLHSDGSITAQGEGELLITSFANTCMPLKRFAVGDNVELIQNGCPCGQPGSYLAQLKGRSVPIFDLGEGVRLSPTIWMKIFEHCPFLKEFQITQVKARKFIVSIQIESGASPNPEAQQRAAIIDFLQKAVQVPLEFDIQLTSFNTQHKFARYRTDII